MSKKAPAKKATTKKAPAKKAPAKKARAPREPATEPSVASAKLPAPPTDTEIQAVLEHFRSQAPELPPEAKGKLAAAMAQATKAPGKAASAAKALAKTLGVSPATIAMYDVVTVALFEASGSAAKARPAAVAAGTCHAAARAMERKLKLGVDLEGAVAWAAVLATRGAIWGKEIALLIKELRAKKRIDLAPRLALASIATVREVEPPSSEVVLALEPLGAALAQQVLVGWITEAPERCASIDADFWVKAPGALALALDAAPALVEWAATHPPDGAGGIEAMERARLTERVAESCPAHARALGQHLLKLAEADRSGRHLASFELLLRPLVPILKARGETLTILQLERDGRGKDYVAPHVVEALLSVQAPLEIAEHGVFQLYAWAHIPLTHPFQHLTRLGQHPLLAQRLAESLGQLLENSAFSQMVAKCAQAEGGRGALDALATLATGLAERGTLGGFRILQEVLGKLCQPDVLAACPAIAEAFERMEAVRLLQGQLRGGLLDEWGWPALDAAVELLDGDIDCCKHSCFPHLTLTSKDRVVVVGIDGVVLDQRDPILEDEGFRWLRRSVYVDGDVFLEAGDYRARWLLGGETIERADLCGLVDLLGGPEQTGAPGVTGPVIHLDGPPLARGETKLGGHYRGWSATCDGRFVYPDGKRTEVITGKAVDGDKPDFFAEALGPGDNRASESFLLPVPRRAARSPLGARDGVGGFISFDTATGERHGVGLDGRRIERRVGGGWYALEAILTFPEREGYYPLIRGHEGHWVYLPDCSMPLACADGDDAPATWGGGPLRLSKEWWHLFLPRDPAGSRALASASLEATRELYEATRQLLSGELVGGVEPGREIPGYEGLRVITIDEQDEPSPLAQWPRVAAAVKEAFPDITHPHLLAGVVRTAVLAVEVEKDLEDLRGRAKLARSNARQGTLKNRDVRLLDPFFHAGFDAPGRWGQDQLGQQLEDVVAFLFGDRPRVPASEQPARVTPAACFVAWERLLIFGAELFPMLLGGAAPESARAQLRSLLELFEKTPLAKPRADMRLACFSFEQTPFSGLGPDSKDRLLEWDNRYFLRCQKLSEPYVFAALEVTRDGTFRTPPGATFLGVEPLDGLADSTRIRRALALLDERGPLPFDPGAAQELSEATGVLPETAELLLNGCHLIDPEQPGRSLLKATLKHVSYARHELEVDELHRIVGNAVPLELEELYQPLTPGADGESHVARLGRLWNAALGKQSALSLDVVDRMEADIKNPHPPFIEAARALQAPERLAAATTDVVWVHRPFHSFTPHALHFQSVPSGWPLHHDAPDTGWAPQWPDLRRAFCYESLGWFMKYLSWAYLELPVGHELRQGAGRLTRSMRQRLAAPHHLLPIALGPVADAGAFTEFLQGLAGKPYAAGDGGPSASGVERGGLIVVVPDGPEPNGLLCTLRTRELGTIESLSRVATLLGIDATERAGSIPGAKLQVFPYWWLYAVWCTPGFTRIADDLEQPAAPEGRWVADPRVSAASVVSALAREHRLDEDAATLLLQIRWLPNPTPRHVQRYNDWKPADYQKAVAPLVERGLVIEKGHQGSDRMHFLPGPVAFFEQYPGPLESVKLEAYGLIENQRPLLNVPLPIIDLPTLFARGI